MNFDYHAIQLCKKTSKNLHALATIFKYVKTPDGRVLVNSFITSQFSYCTLIWMLHSRRMKYRIDKIHEMVLRVIYPYDLKLKFKELLDKNKTVGIHQKLTTTSH